MPETKLATKRLLITAGVLVGALVILIVFRAIFWPLLLAVAIAYLLDPFVSRLERKRIPRTVGVILTGAGFVLVLTAVGAFLVPAIWAQVVRLLQRLPDYWNAVDRMWRPWFARITDQLPAPAQSLPETLIRALQEHVPQLATSMGHVTANLFSNLLDALLFLISLLFVLVFTFYVLRDFPRIRTATFDLVPIPYRPMVRARMQEVSGVVSGFVRGQLTIAAINGTVYAIGLTLIGVPMGLVLGLAAGLGNLIPYMSIVVGLVPALLLSWVEQQSLTRLLLVLALFGVVVLNEDIVLRPRILGRSVKLHPVWILLAIIAGGELLGVFGMILAVPVAGVIQVFLRHWLEVYRHSRFYRGAAVDLSGVIHVEGEAVGSAESRVPSAGASGEPQAAANRRMPSQGEQSIISPSTQSSPRK